MRIGPLALFSATNSKGHFNLASYHSRHSLTWSWILSISFSRSWLLPNGFPRFIAKGWTNNHGWQWIVSAPFVTVQWQRQGEMWFRDLFAKARDREDDLDEQNRKLRQALTVARASALANVDQGRPQ